MATDVLQQLESFKKNDHYTIISLSKSVNPDEVTTPDKRGSGASSGDFTGATPRELAADLESYQEQFSKLRLSYIEQVTKEKFLRALVCSPPNFADAQENVRLESTLSNAKESLKRKKADVAELLANLEQTGRELSRRYDATQLQVDQVASLPAEISRLEEYLSQLHSSNSAVAEESGRSLAETLSVIEEQEARDVALTAELESLERQVTTSNRKIEVLHSVIRPLEEQGEEAVAIAKEAERRREAGETETTALEQQGRWLTAVDRIMQSVL